MALTEIMHQIFGTGSSLLVGIFRCLVELDRQNGADRNLETLLITMSILFDRSHLALVCRSWSELLSTTQSMSLASLHWSTFGCHGAAREIVARYTALKNLHRAACNLEDSLCKRTIAKFLMLPWRLRVARLDKYCQVSDTFSREIFREELARAQNFFSPQTVALVERTIVAFSEGTSIPTTWPPASQHHLHTVYMKYELLNLRGGHQREVVPDEFVGWFKNVEIHPWSNMHREHGCCWVVKARVKLSSVLCLPEQFEPEVKCTCLFNFREQSFGATIRVFLGSRLDLTLDFITISPSSTEVVYA